MPIYEYRCPSCEERFEELVRSSDPAVACPSCGTADVERLLSVFAGVGGSSAVASSPTPSQVVSRGGACGPGCGCH
jgi:putative FmdB family regulatory protein